MWELYIHCQYVQWEIFYSFLLFSLGVLKISTVHHHCFYDAVFWILLYTFRITYPFQGS